MYGVIILNLKLLFVDSTAQSVLCQPIVQSNGELVGKSCTIALKLWLALSRADSTGVAAIKQFLSA